MSRLITLAQQCGSAARRDGVEVGGTALDRSNLVGGGEDEVWREIPDQTVTAGIAGAVDEGNGSASEEQQAANECKVLRCRIGEALAADDELISLIKAEIEDQVEVCGSAGQLKQDAIRPGSAEMPITLARSTQNIVSPAAAARRNAGGRLLADLRRRGDPDGRSASFTVDGKSAVGVAQAQLQLVLVELDSIGQLQCEACRGLASWDDQFTD